MTRIIHPSLTCEEQGTSGSVTQIIHSSLTCDEQGTSGSVNFGNDFLKLTHRKSFKIRISSTRSNSFPARAHYCIKCNAPTTPFLSYRHHDESLCNECALRLKRWGSLAVVAKTLIRWKAFVVADKPALVDCMEDENESNTGCVNGKEHPSLPGDPQMVGVEPDVNFSSCGLHESDSIHIEQTFNSHGNNYFSGVCARAAKFMFKCLYAITKVTIKVIWSWNFFKWLMKVMNLLVEVGQAIMDQKNGESKLKVRTYRMISVILASICLAISLIEIIGEGRAKKVVWRKKRWGCWFYYPGNEGRLFGKFSLYFGVISSGVQFVINLISFVIKKSFIKFVPLPLLLAFGQILAALTDSGDQGQQVVSSSV